MTEGEAAAYRPSGCAWGCFVVLGLGLVLLILGFQVFAKLGMVFIFTSSLVHALRNRSYWSVFSERTLRRDAQPFAFWSVFALNAALALASLWMLTDEVRKAMS